MAFPSKYTIESCPGCRGSHPAGTEITKRNGAWVPVSCSGSASAPVSRSVGASGAATYARIGDGWGVRCSGKSGDVVSVTTKAGKTKRETLGEEVRPGVFATVMREGRRYECEECGEYVTSGSGSCWETGAAH